MRVIVGVSDMKGSNDPETILVTHALGSCIGVVIYDAVAKVGGLLHYLLPESKLSPEKFQVREKVRYEDLKSIIKKMIV